MINICSSHLDTVSIVPDPPYCLQVQFGTDPTLGRKAGYTDTLKPPSPGFSQVILMNTVSTQPSHIKKYPSPPASDLGSQKAEGSHLTHSALSLVLSTCSTNTCDRASASPVYRRRSTRQLSKQACGQGGRTRPMREKSMQGQVCLPLCSI